MRTEPVGSLHTDVSPLWLLLFILVCALIAFVIADIVRGDLRVVLKWAWGIAVVVSFPLGPLLYLLWGRARQPVAHG